MVKNRIDAYAENNRGQIFRMLNELCAIPAPSHYEEQRAAYCKEWLENAGAAGVYIDEAQNVIFPYQCENSSAITVFAAHTDTVFPDREPMPYIDDGERIHSPGVADDTASVVVLLLMAKYFIENRIECKDGILFVCNSCEEGLGNLKGTRQLFADYAGRINRFITFDSNLDTLNDRCVGSHRYEIETVTAGGHSYGAFGNENAINALAGIIRKIYEIEVPQKENARTTYNVGTVSGGTSVNTIAQSAKMLCEYRSDDPECLAYMQEKFERIFAEAKNERIKLNIRKVGDRPCSIVPDEEIGVLKALVVPVIEAEIGKNVRFTSSSTDCNIPLSLGVPAICIGTNTHAGIHTREEWVDKESIVKGLRIAIAIGEKATVL